MSNTSLIIENLTKRVQTLEQKLRELLPDSAQDTSAGSQPAKMNLFKFLGSIEGPTDASTNKHKYIH